MFVAVLRSNTTYARFTLHDFSLFHSPTGFDKSLTNARHRRQIGARSRFNYQKGDLRELAVDSSTPVKYLVCQISGAALRMSSD